MMNKLIRTMWLYAFILIVLCIFMAFTLFRLKERIEDANASKHSRIDFQISQLKRKIHKEQEDVNQFESMTLWSDPQALMSLLTEQAKIAKVSIIGVWQMPEKNVSSYIESSVKLTLQGDYHALSRFLNQLEHADNLLKINSFSITHRRQSSDNDLIMQVILSCFRVGQSVQAVKGTTQARQFREAESRESGPAPHGDVIHDGH